MTHSSKGDHRWRSTFCGQICGKWCPELAYCASLRLIASVHCSTLMVALAGSGVRG